MAIENEILVGRLNQALRKLTGIKGKAPSPQLASEIMPSFVLPLGVEFRYLESWDIFGFQAQVAPVAAQFGTIRLRNPSGSNVVGVIQKLTVVATAADQPLLFAITSGAADLATIGTQTNLDFRTQRAKGALVVSSSTLAAHAGTQFWQSSLTATVLYTDAILYENQELPLLPGQAVDLASNFVNQAINCSIWWRERFLEEGERF